MSKNTVGPFSPPGSGGKGRIISGTLGVTQTLGEGADRAQLRCLSIDLPSWWRNRLCHRLLGRFDREGGIIRCGCNRCKQDNSVNQMWVIQTLLNMNNTSFAQCLKDILHETERSLWKAYPIFSLIQRLYIDEIGQETACSPRELLRFDLGWLEEEDLIIPVSPNLSTTRIERVCTTHGLTLDRSVMDALEANLCWRSEDTEMVVLHHRAARDPLFFQNINKERSYRPQITMALYLLSVLRQYHGITAAEDSIHLGPLQVGQKIAIEVITTPDRIHTYAYLIIEVDRGFRWKISVVTEHPLTTDKIPTGTFSGYARDPILPPNIWDALDNLPSPVRHRGARTGC